MPFLRIGRLAAAPAEDGFNGGITQVNLNAVQTGGDYVFLNQMLNAGFVSLGDNSGVPTPDDLDSNGYPLPGSDAMTNHSGVYAVGFITGAYNETPIMAVQFTGKGWMFGMGTVQTIAVTGITTGADTTLHFSGGHWFTVGMEVPFNTSGMSATGTIATVLGTKRVITSMNSTSITFGGVASTGTWTSGGVASYGDMNCGVATGGRCIVDVSGSPSANGYQITYWILATDAVNPLTKVAVVYRGSEEDRYNAGEVFSTPFLDRMREANFGVVRFLNNMNTNISNIVNWADRCPVDYICYGGTRLKSSIYAGTLAGTANAYTGSISLGALTHGAQVSCRFPMQAVTGVTIGAGGVITTSGAHGLAVGDVFNVFGNFSGTTDAGGIRYVPGGIPSYDINSGTYGGGTVDLYVLSVPTSSTLTFSTSPGGSAFTTTGSTGTFNLHKTVLDMNVTFSGSTITAARKHALAVGDIVGFEERNASVLPTNINGHGGYYYVKTVPTDTTLTIAATSGGTAITFTGSPTGTNSMCQLPTVNVDALGAKPILTASGSNLSKDGTSIPRARTFSFSAPLCTLTYDSVMDAWLIYGSQDGWQAMGVEASAWPWEHAFRLCLELGAHPWFCSPPYTLDPVTDFMPSLAKYVKDNTPAWMRPIYEIQNEQWNGQFFAATLSQNHAYKYIELGYWPGPAFAPGDQAAGKMASGLGQALAAVYGSLLDAYDCGVGVQTGVMTGPSIPDHDGRFSASDYVGQSNAVQSPLSGDFGTITFVKQSAALWTNFVAPATYFHNTFRSEVGLATETAMAIQFNGKAFRASISGTAMTVSGSMVFGSLAVGDTLFGDGIPSWDTPCTIVSGSHPNWVLSANLGTLALRSLWAAEDIQPAIDYVDDAGSAAGGFNIAQDILLWTGTRDWAQQSGFNDGNGGTKKMYGYEGGWSPDFSGTGQFSYTLTNMLRHGSKYVTSSANWPDGLQGALTEVYDEFIALGGQWPSCFQFSGPSPISGIWCVLEDIYQVPDPPQWKAIVAYNN